MPELPNPPHNTPPWVWVAACVLVAFTTAATPILLPRLLDGRSSGNTAQNAPDPQAPSTSPSPTPSVEYKGDPVGEVPYREGAITVELVPRTITAPIDGIVEVCGVKSLTSFEGGAVGELGQVVSIKKLPSKKEKFISFRNTGCTTSLVDEGEGEIQVKKGDKIKVYLDTPQNLNGIPRYIKPTVKIVKN